VHGHVALRRYGVEARSRFDLLGSFFGFITLDFRMLHTARTIFRAGRVLTAASALAALSAPALAQWAPEFLPAYDQPDSEVLVHESHIGCGKACRHKAIIEQQIAAGLDMSQAGPQTPIPGRFASRGDRGATTDPTDVLNYNLTIEVAPPSTTITGTNVITVRSNQAGLNSFTFRLRWNFTVSSCTVTDSLGTYSVTPTVPVAGSNPPSYGRTFSLLRPVNAGETFTVTINYTGAGTSVGLGSLAIGTQGGVAGAPPIFTTLSEPYYAASWWPPEDGDVQAAGDNADKATYNVSIICPNTLQAVSNGLLQGVDALSGNRSRYRWATNYQMAAYLLFISVTQYNQWQVTYNYPGGSMPVQFSVYPSRDTPARRTAWEQVVPMMEAFRPVYGLYPFINEKYGIYQFEFGGGMEHQTYTGQGGSGDTPFGESLTAHELGHQWWGDNVTCRTWADIWLNEGFATYSEAIWLERKPGSTGLPALAAAMVARKPSNPNNSVYCTDVTSVSRIFDNNASYRKGAWVAHGLRRLLGDTTFFAALQNYRAQFQGSAATTGDFIASFNATSGQDLNWFFTPWVFGNGAPNYTFGYQPAVIDGQNYLKLHVSQVNQSSGAGATTVFANPLDVSINTSAGTVNAVVRMDSARDDYLIPLPTGATVSAVGIDPNDWVLNYGKTLGTYSAGPPKLVTSNIAPGATLAVAGAPASLRLVFSDGVNASASNFALTKAGSPVPFTFSNASGIVNLTFSSALTAGVYSVAISDAVTSAVSSQALDGEISGTVLPSGNGNPGGIAAFSFTVTAPPCLADFNGANGVTVQDIFDFLAAWFANSPSADFNAANGVTIQDIFDFLAAWFAGCA
jgi:Peptidase family M1 domain/Peptidase M1 N-terminal domain